MPNTSRMPQSKKYAKHPVLMKFAKIIKDTREKMGISQEELAFIAGVHRTYIGMIERGEQNVTLLTIRRIADALGVSLAEIFAPFTDKKTNKVKLLKEVRKQLEEDNKY